MRHRRVVASPAQPPHLRDHELDLVEETDVERSVTRPSFLLVMRKEVAHTKVLGQRQVRIDFLDLHKPWRRLFGTGPEAFRDVRPDAIAVDRRPQLGRERHHHRQRGSVDEDALGAIHEREAIEPGLVRGLEARFERTSGLTRQRLHGPGVGERHPGVRQLRRIAAKLDRIDDRLAGQGEQHANLAAAPEGVARRERERTGALDGLDLATALDELTRRLVELQHAYRGGAEHAQRCEVRGGSRRAAARRRLRGHGCAHDRPQRARTPRTSMCANGPCAFVAR